MDPSKTNNHFGDTPIFGLVFSNGKDMKNMMHDSNIIGSAKMGQGQGMSEGNNSINNNSNSTQRMR